MSMDHETASELKQSSLWSAVVDELNDRIKSCEMQFRTCKPEELNNLQLRIKGYEEMKNLPQDVMDREDSGA